VPAATWKGRQNGRIEPRRDVLPNDASRGSHVLVILPESPHGFESGEYWFRTERRAKDSISFCEIVARPSQKRARLEAGLITEGLFNESE
jgi:hypothetical protein